MTKLFVDLASSESLEFPLAEIIDTASVNLTSMMGLNLPLKQLSKTIRRLCGQGKIRLIKV